MEQTIIGMIAEAERAAAARKEEAQSGAAQTIAEAEARASEIAKQSAASLRRLREETLERAEDEASSAYQSAIGQARREAAAYADGILASAETSVYEIVGRLTK